MGGVGRAGGWEVTLLMAATLERLRRLVQARRWSGRGRTRGHGPRRRLDKPTGRIRPSIVHAMAARICGLRESRGLAVLPVEQNPDFIRALLDRALLVQRGRIVRKLPADQLDDPALEREFISA